MRVAELIDVRLTADEVKTIVRDRLITMDVMTPEQARNATISVETDLGVYIHWDQNRSIDSNEL